MKKLYKKFNLISMTFFDFLCHSPWAFCGASPSQPFAHRSLFSDRFKDGMVASEHCSRYHLDGTSLVIRDVAEEDAGKYTVLVRIQEHGLYQNLTLTLMVNGETEQIHFSQQSSSAMNVNPQQKH